MSVYHFMIFKQLTLLVSFEPSIFSNGIEMVGTRTYRYYRANAVLVIKVVMSNYL